MGSGMDGGAFGEHPPALRSAPAQDSLLLPLLHGEGTHGPNVAQGLICHTCCPGDLQGTQELGSQDADGEGDQGAQGAEKERSTRGVGGNSNTCS